MYYFLAAVIFLQSAFIACQSSSDGADEVFRGESQKSEKEKEKEGADTSSNASDDAKAKEPVHPSDPRADDSDFKPISFPSCGDTQRYQNLVLCTATYMEILEAYVDDHPDQNLDEANKILTDAVDQFYQFKIDGLDRYPASETVERINRMKAAMTEVIAAATKSALKDQVAKGSNHIIALLRELVRMAA
jgi:hypothetical protein